ncbi:MAG: HEAT repeat domain-containing protein [Planctomycetota bacterium]
MHRPVACVAVLAALSGSLFGQSLEGTFNEGVDLLKRGRNAEALAKFQQCLAMDPGNDAAYELFQQTEHDVWLDLLVEGGDYELVAKRLMGLASMGRAQRQNDPDAISALIQQLGGDDVVQRVAAVHSLSANHGEYAVPQLLYALGDPDNDDRRVIHMQALTEMGGDVVLPLLAGLDSSDPFLRRNIALVLGYIGDPRANGWMAALAASDEDGGVRDAASEALAKCGGTPNAVAQLLELGNAWHASDSSVLMPHQVSEVTWHWDGSKVASTAVPTFLYNEELAKSAFYAALRANAGSTESLAGIARASAAQHGELAARAGAGEDVGDWAERLAADDLAIQVAGANALDLALLWALETGDDVAASGLCRALASAATAPTQGLRAALASRSSGAVRGEAAVALGTIAAHTSTAADGSVVAALAEAAGREVLQIAGIIDGQDARRGNLAQVLSDQGLSVAAWGSGARGLASLRQVPGLDVLLVAESLPDLTFAQVVDEVRADPALAATPILILAADGEAAMELWGERATDAISGPADLTKVADALAGGLNRDREEANRLAASAAHTLHQLAGAGHTDLGNAPLHLASTVASRPDEVTVPAMHALGLAGSRAHVGALLGVLGDDARSDAAREAAGMALSGIFGRDTGFDDAGALGTLNEIANSDAAFGVRRAAATALGRLNLPAEQRAGLVQAVRANLAGE